MNLPSDALVVGGGVVGLSAAIRLAESGWRVTRWSADPPAATTSAVAAAVWFPYEAGPRDRVLAWGDATRRELERLAREAPESGVRIRAGLDVWRDPVPDPWWGAALPSVRRCAPGELPPGYRDGFAFDVPVADMARYLPHLVARADALGIVAVCRRVASLDEALAVCPVVVNCTGLAAGALTGDASVTPIRGQVVRTTNPGVERVLFDDAHPEGMTYVVPRDDDCILGGTADRDVWDLTPDPATAARILARCTVLEPRLAGAQVLEHRVGLRPGRPTVRLAVEHRDGGVCIHDYGHGGAGVTLSWGCADEVVALATSARGVDAAD